MLDVEFTDRYDALGIKPPKQLTACYGSCEGTGVVPVYRECEATATASCTLAGETDPKLITRWEQAEAADPTDDGWHFVRCPSCEGSGQAKGMLTPLRRLLPQAIRNARFAWQHLSSRQTWRMDVPHPTWFNVKLIIRIALTTW